MTSGRVSFIGAGPGAADLITLRGAKRIAEADIVVWAASLVDPECVREHARPDAELIDSSRITHDDVLEVYRRAAGQRLKVARVHSGDPSLWGAVQEQYDSAVRLGLDVEIVPGVSAFSAAAAIAGRELTVPEVAQSVILTRLEGGKTPMPDGEHIRDFARHGTTMAIFLSAARSGQLVDELRAGGYPDDTPVVIAYKVTWPDELVLHTTIGELSETVKQHKLWRHTLFLVGKSLSATGTRSHLYNAGHFHTFRKADPAARRALRAAEQGIQEDTDIGAGRADEVVAATRPRTAGWPLQASRSGWVAARVGSGSWTSGGARSGVSGSGDATGQDGAGQPASVAAWSAVHGWQQTARSTSRGGAKPGKPIDAPRPLRPVPTDQETFTFEPATEEPTREQPTPERSTPVPVAAEQPKPEPAKLEPIKVEPVKLESVKPVPVALEPAKPAPVALDTVALDPVDVPKSESVPAVEVQKSVDVSKPKPQGRQGGRRSGPKRSNNNGRKVAGRSSQPGGQGRPADQS
jgi:precorrin-4 C11-methyltransferase